MVADDRAAAAAPAASASEQPAERLQQAAHQNHPQTLPQSGFDRVGERDARRLFDKGLGSPSKRAIRFQSVNLSLREGSHAARSL